MRARRRHDQARMKVRARRIMALWSRHLPDEAPSGRAVGRNASTHCRPCSCWLCRPEKRVRSKPDFTAELRE